MSGEVRLTLLIQVVLVDVPAFAVQARLLVLDRVVDFYSVGQLAVGFECGHELLELFDEWVSFLQHVEIRVPDHAVGREESDEELRVDDAGQGLDGLGLWLAERTDASEVRAARLVFAAEIDIVIEADWEVLVQVDPEAVPSALFFVGVLV